MNRLVTDDDIRAAVQWRLSDWSAQEIEKGIDQVVQHDGCIDGLVLQFNDRHVADSRTWSAVCALAVGAAERLRDTSLYYRAGYVVLESRQQSMRSTCRAGGDALNGLILTYLRELPEISPAVLWNEFQRLAEDRHSVIDEYDAELEAIFYRPSSDDDRVKEISFTTFRKRFWRMKKIYSSYTASTPVSWQAK